MTLFCILFRYRKLLHCYNFFLRCFRIFWGHPRHNRVQPSQIIRGHWKENTDRRAVFHRRWREWLRRYREVRTQKKVEQTEQRNSADLKGNYINICCKYAKKQKFVASQSKHRVGNTESKFFPIFRTSLR